jgi:H+/Cl- antiporter ClcA
LPAPPLTPLLQFMNPFRTGKLVLFQVSYDRDWHYFEMFFYSIIGVFGVRRLLPGVPPLC